jgi:uncharacterized membrane protein YgcG
MFTAILFAALASSPVVVDQAHLLNDEQTLAVQKEFSEIQKDDHVTMGLFTLPTSTDIKSQAYQAINQFDLGPNSVVMLVSMQPRKIYIQPGTQLASRFSSSTVDSLVKSSMVPAMGSGRYGDGIIRGVKAVRSTLEDSWHLGWWLFGLLIVGLLGYLFWRRTEVIVVRTRFINMHQTGSYSASGARPVSRYTRRESSGGTTVINNNTGDGFIEGMLIGDMLNNRGSQSVPAVQPSAPSPSYQDGGSLGGGGASFDDAPDTSGGGSDFGDTSGGGSSFSDDSGSGSDVGDSSSGGSDFGGGSDSGGSFDGGSSGGGSDF